MNSPLRICFYGEFEYNSGISETLLKYKKASDDSIQISVSGYVGSTVASNFRVISSDAYDEIDRFVFVTEDIPYLDPERYPRRAESIDEVPQRKRFVIDMDGKYGVSTSNKDKWSSEDQQELDSWRRMFNFLSDIVMQPSFSPSSDAIQHLFYGYSGEAVQKAKSWEVVYVGNNWYKWEDISNLLIEDSEEILDIALFGKWWGNEAHSLKPRASYSNERVLEMHDVDILDSVPFGDLVNFMSMGRINPVLIRSALRDKSLITPRMIETLEADTFPLVPYEDPYIRNLYGEEVEEFREDSFSDLLQRVVNENNSLDDKRKDIRDRLSSKHSIEKRLEELVDILD